MDEIAAVAGVNKALIYYYFESKDSLLEELVNRVLKELIAEKGRHSTSPHAEGYVDEIMHRGIEMTEKRMPILAVLCMEAMKSEERQTALLQVSIGSSKTPYPLPRNWGSRGK